MPLLEFIVITVITWVAGGALMKFLFSMMQPDGALDVVFGWAKMLDRFYAKADKGSALHRWLHDSLGGCAMCTSFWFAPIWFACYWGFCESVLGYFIYDYAETTIGKVFSFAMWYVMYWSIGAMVSLLTITMNKK